MNIEEILSRLERIDHKEYSSGFEFADSSTFDEMGRCFEERKILAKEIERLNNIINEKNKMINNTRHFMANLELSTLKEKEHLHDIDMRLMYIYNYWGVDKE